MEKSLFRTQNTEAYSFPIHDIIFNFFRTDEPASAPYIDCISKSDIKRESMFYSLSQVFGKI